MEITYKHYKITSEFLGNKTHHLNPLNSNNHIITIKNLKTGTEVVFKYWGTVYKVKIIKDNELLNAFYDFLMEAYDTQYGYDEFCETKGYSNEETLIIYNNSVENADKVYQVLDGDNMNDLVDDIWNEL